MSDDQGKYKYKVLIHWPGCRADFQVVVIVSADTPEEAARQRVAKLIEPQKYTRVLVLSEGCDQAYIYDMRDMIEGKFYKPRPRYGWRG